MKRIFCAGVAIDNLLLAWVLVCRWFCEDWFSMSCQQFERGLIALYVLPFVLDLLGRRQSVFMASLCALSLICIAFVAVMMWMRQKQPDGYRVHRFVSSSMVGLRLAMVLLALLLGGMRLAVPPHEWWDLVMFLPMAAYAIFEYSTSLPGDGGGKRGKKRKLALARLKELLGGRLPDGRCRDMRLALSL